MSNVEGNCLCKSVSFSFELDKKEFAACHCSMCRTWGGGPAFTVEPSSGIQMSGEENIQIYNSSEWAQRGFCGKCGTHLFYRLKDKSLNFCNFNLGTITNLDDFEFKTEIFIDHKPACYSFANKTKKMTEKEVLYSFNS